MIRLYVSGKPEPLATITDDQLAFLVNELEEESLTDQEYAITPMTLGLFVEDGIDAGLLQILQDALGDQGEISLRWEQD